MPKFMIELLHKQNCSQKANSCSLVVSCNLISYPNAYGYKNDKISSKYSRDGRMLGKWLEKRRLKDFSVGALQFYDSVKLWDALLDLRKLERLDILFTIMPFRFTSVLPTFDFNLRT